MNKLCDYQKAEVGYRCSRCGDRTDNKDLRRVCPALRNGVVRARTWAYGVTTCEERVLAGILQTTLESLEKAGFDAPRLFVDGMDGYPPFNHRYNVTYRSPKLRTFGNWMLTLWELYVRDPHADLYAIFQDDCVAVRNLREYIDRVDLPENGYLNLYTFPQNEKDISGFYESNQLGKGAVGIIIPREGIVPLLSSKHMADRPRDFKRGHRNVDGGIVTAFKKAGWKEYVHNPSLLQHTGDESSMGNRKFEKARTFPGEDFDALSLLNVSTGTFRVREDDRPRIALFGPNDDTIIGTMNGQVARYCEHVTTWIHRDSREFPSPDVPRTVEAMRCDVGNPRKILWAVNRTEVVLFVGRPPYRLLLDVAKQEGKRIVCVPYGLAHEEDWMDDVSLFVCPTKESYELLGLRYPCGVFPWPPDPSSFPFHLRESWRHSLFVAREREASGLVIPDGPLLCKGLEGTTWPPKSLQATIANAQHLRSLYEDGDVLVGNTDVVTAMEAMSCGIPVVGAEEPLPKFAGYNRGEEIARASFEAREWCECNRWQGRVVEFEALVRDGTHKITLPFKPKDSALNA